MQDLIDILKELIKIRSDLNLNQLDDNNLFNVGSNIFISNNIARQSKAMDFEEVEEPATEKQIYAIQKLGIEFDKNISKREAYFIIKEAKENGKDANKEY